MPGAIGIAGAGRVAQTLGLLLRRCGEPVAAVASRSPARAQAAAAFIGAPAAVTYSELPEHCPRVLIAVSDDAIPTVVASMLESPRLPQAVLHTSGVHGSGILEPLVARGVSCAALHPLQTIASPDQGVSALPGSTFAITGEGAAAGWAMEVAALLNGPVIRVPAESRALYHAAAVMASNYSVALMDAALQLLRLASRDADDAGLLRAIKPLVNASVENALESGPLRALTGPVERGDAGAVRLHINALAEAPESIRRLYCAAGLHALDMSKRKGLAEADATAIAESLTGGNL